MVAKHLARARHTAQFSCVCAHLVFLVIASLKVAELRPQVVNNLPRVKCLRTRQLSNPEDEATEPSTTPWLYCASGPVSLTTIVCLDHHRVSEQGQRSCVQQALISELSSVSCL